MWGVAVLLAKFQNEVQGSEMFMTAKRSVGTGLIASAVVSGWTIAATLLTSTSWTYSYGVSGIHTINSFKSLADCSGAYFYGAFASVQIFVFAVAAIALKRKAPGAHTFLEIAKIRYGRTGHCIQIFYSTLLQVCLSPSRKIFPDEANIPFEIINCVNVLVGGSAVFTALTGMNDIAAVWLLPVGVVICTVSLARWD